LKQNLKYICLIVFSIFIVNIGYKYFEYKKIISHSIFIKAKIVNQYKKKNYYVLKLKNNEVTFYTTTKDDLKDILNREVEVGVITKNIKFFDFLTTFYAPTYHLGILDIPKYKKFINNQHKDKYIANIFDALFFGDSLYHKTRLNLSTLGISHLFALSGLHLAIISGFLYLILTPFYKLVAPSYRNRNIDLGILIIGILFLYLWFVNFPPSLVRSFIMECVVFLVAFNLKNILNFKVLFLTIIFSLVLFPSFIFSIGFFLSVSGVFFIFLFFRYFKVNWINGIFVLPIFLYITMFPISHYFFGNFNTYQLLSPFISILFSLFYPLEIFLHLIHQGGILDNIIINYLELGQYFINIYTSFWMFFLYLSIMITIFIKNLT